MPESVLKSLVAMVFSNSTTKVKQFKQDHAGSVIGLTPEVQADNFLHSQVAQGYIILDNNRYIMNFTMQDNEIRLNGKAITIDFLLAD